MRATACAVVVANRPTGEVISGEMFDECIQKGALSVLQAITSTPLDSEMK